MQGLFQTICRIGIFMICAQAAVHFRPRESYEKYLKLLVSAMVLIQLFLPVGRFLSHMGGGEEEVLPQAFLEGLEEEMWAAESRAREADALLEQMTLEEVRRRVEEAQRLQREAELETGTGPVTGTSSGTGTGPETEAGPGTGTGPEIGTGPVTGTGSETETAPGESGEDDPAAVGEDHSVRIDRIQVEDIRIRISADPGE